MHSASVQDRPENRATRLLMWAGHYSDALIWVFIASVIANDALSRPGWLQWLFTAITVAWMLTMAADIQIHMNRLCERCAASTPLDWQAAVQRWRRALWWRHQRKAYYAVGIVVIVILIIDTLSAHRASWWVYAVHALGFTALGLNTIPGHQHRRLQPWCPWCHWDDGGDEEISPDVPAPAVSR